MPSPRMKLKLDRSKLMPGTPVRATISPLSGASATRVRWVILDATGTEVVDVQSTAASIPLDTSMLVEGTYSVLVDAAFSDGTVLNASESFEVVDSATTGPEEPPVVQVVMKRTSAKATPDQLLWPYIRQRTLQFSAYEKAVDAILCEGKLDADMESKVCQDWKQRLASSPFARAERYTLLKVATECYMKLHCAVAITEYDLSNMEAELTRLNRPSSTTSADLLAEWMQDYLVATDVAGDPTDFLVKPRERSLRRFFKDAPLKIESDGASDNCFGVLAEKLSHPCLVELIWSYWHEEAMLVQSLNAISLRFQNRRSSSGRDSLAELELSPLRPLNNLLWGYIQDEQHRLSIQRRSYEYDHHYGLRLQGKAIQAGGAFSDSRTKFLEAFHVLLNRCATFFRESDNTMVVPDGFPVLNALKEVHLLLSQGQHNQYGDLPWTSRMEMLMQQWLIARPEIREFLPTRASVTYPEAWMGPIDAMRRLQGWGGDSVLYYRDLGVYGEQLLLGIRHGHWTDVTDADQAANWATYWRPEIQAYMHAYRTVTGADLSRSADATLPSTLIRQRIAATLRAA